jgi:large subunit ribosomal protein L4
MLEVPVYNTSGQQVDTLQIEEQAFGGEVNPSLIKQAVVAYHANGRRGTAHTRGRGEVAGSTKKLFRQKGTGRARRGNIRTNIMRGGGVAFAKKPHSFRKALPKKMRRGALNSAILAKILGEDLLVVDGLSVDEPRTRVVADVLSNLNVGRSCLLTIDQHNEALWKSARNIPGLLVRAATDLNAFDVATKSKMLMTREAMDLLLEARA